MKKLGDICDIKMGQSPSSNSYNAEKIGLPFFQGNADFGSKYPCVRLYCSAPIKVANKGDVLFSVRAPIGAINIAEQLCCIGRGLAALTPKNSTLEYLYFLLKAKSQILQSIGTGSTFKAITKISLFSLPIPDHSVLIQNQITQKLSLLEKLINEREEQVKSFDMLAKSRFIEMFGDISNNSKNIEISTLGKECIIISGGTPRTGNDEYWNGNIKWITPAEINEIERTIYDTERHITEKGRRSAHLEIMPKGTVLLSSRAPIGKLAIAGSEMTCNQGFKNLIPNDRLTSIFLYYYLKGIIPEIQSLGRGATFKEISKAIVSDIKILVPPKNKQLAFSSLVELLDKSKFRMKKCLKLLSYIRHL
mgnify:CR=1 FL=1